VPGQPHQHRHRPAVLTQMGQPAVAGLMQRPPGVLLEQVLGPRVGQPVAAGGRIDVAGGQSAHRRGPPLGQEHRSGSTAAEQPWEQPGGVGLPQDPVDVAALESAPVPRFLSGSAGGPARCCCSGACDWCGLLQPNRSNQCSTCERTCVLRRVAAGTSPRSLSRKYEFDLGFVPDPPPPATPCPACPPGTQIIQQSPNLGRPVLASIPARRSASPDLLALLRDSQMAGAMLIEASECAKAT
jgi:hypothetical protein